MYKYFSLRQLESDILDTRAQASMKCVTGIEVNSIRVVMTEDDFQKLQVDVKEKINIMAGGVPNPEIQDATINNINFADIQVFFERIKSGEIQDAEIVA